jgi:hypothetical protein
MGVTFVNGVTPVRSDGGVREVPDSPRAMLRNVCGSAQAR